MVDFATIAAEAREASGKGGARQMRRDGRVPGVIYGNKIAPVHISVDRREFTMLMEDPGFFTQVFDVKIGNDSHHVLARDVQNHPVTDTPLHVDFFEFDENTKIESRLHSAGEMTNKIPNDLDGDVKDDKNPLKEVEHPLDMFGSSKNNHFL